MSHEVISSFIAIGMFVLFALIICGVVGGIGAIIEAFHERNDLRVKANARNEIYSRQGQEVAELRARIKSLELINETHDLDKNELIASYEEELARKDKIIEGLNKAIASNKKKTSTGAAAEVKTATKA